LWRLLPTSPAPASPVLHKQVFECFPATWETSATLDDGWRGLPLDMAPTARNLSFHPPRKKASTRGGLLSMDRVPAVSTGVHPLTALQLLGGVVLLRGIAGGGISPRTPCLWPTVP